MVKRPAKKPVSIEAVRDDYAALAPDYDERWLAFSSLVYQWVLDNWPGDLPGDASVLDSGCGTAEMLQRIHELMPQAHLTGIDGSFDMLKQAGRKCNTAHFIESNLEETIPDMVSWDVVISLNVLHHINDQAAYLDRLVGSLKSGGTLFLCDFAVDSPAMKVAEFCWRLFHPAHYKALSSLSLKKLLTVQNLRIMESGVLRSGLFWRLQIYKLAK